LNLKDRMNSGLETQKPQNAETAPKIPKQNTSSDTMQKSNQLSLESLVEAQAEVIRKQKEVIRQKDETIALKENQIQTLSSEKLKLTSTVAKTSEELLYTQKQNLEIVKENDDLRNSAGLMSRKEQQRLTEELTTMKARLSDTEKLVNMSHVESVKEAQAAKQAAEAKAKQDIANCKEEANRKVSNAITAKADAIRLANTKIKAAKKREQIAWGALIVTLFCCLMAYPAFLEDVWEFISAPIMWALDNISIYAEWMATPYYSKFEDGSERLFAYSTGVAWILRILSSALLIATITGISYGIYKLWLYYRKRWCNLSLKVLLISLAVMIVFGSSIKSINLVLLLVIIQMVYLGVLIYLDGYFEDHHKAANWKKIQHS